MLYTCQNILSIKEQFLNKQIHAQGVGQKVSQATPLEAGGGKLFPFFALLFHPIISQKI